MASPTVAPFEGSLPAPSVPSLPLYGINGSPLLANNPSISSPLISSSNEGPARDPLLIAASPLLSLSRAPPLIGPSSSSSGSSPSIASFLAAASRLQPPQQQQPREKEEDNYHLLLDLKFNRRGSLQEMTPTTASSPLLPSITLPSLSSSGPLPPLNNLTNPSSATYNSPNFNGATSNSPSNFNGSDNGTNNSANNRRTSNRKVLPTKKEDFITNWEESPVLSPKRGRKRSFTGTEDQSVSSPPVYNVTFQAQQQQRVDGSHTNVPTQRVVQISEDLVQDDDYDNNEENEEGLEEDEDFIQEEDEEEFNARMMRNARRASTGSIPNYAFLPKKRMKKGQCDNAKCGLCLNGAPKYITSNSGWRDVVIAVFECIYSSSAGLSEEDWLYLPRDVYDFVQTHWHILCGPIKRPMYHNWKKKIQDTLSHNKTYFDSGKKEFGTTGYWRMKKGVLAQLTTRTPTISSNYASSVNPFLAMSVANTSVPGNPSSPAVSTSSPSLASGTPSPLLQLPLPLFNNVPPSTSSPSLPNKNYHSISSIINNTESNAGDVTASPSLAPQNDCGTDRSPSHGSEPESQEDKAKTGEKVDIKGEIKRMKDEVTLLWQDLVKKTQRNFATLDLLMQSVDRLEKLASTNLSALEDTFQGRMNEFATVESLLAELKKA